MSVSDKQIEDWLHAREDEHVEFKKAESTFDSRKLANYCVALANEGGGCLVLGITDKFPRRVVGTQAYVHRLPKVLRSLRQQIPHLHVEAEETRYREERVVVFSVGGRPVGTPLSFEGRFWQRNGEELVHMGPQELQRVFEESQPDFSAETVPGGALEHLDPEAVEVFRRLWIEKSGNANLANQSPGDLLSDAGLLNDGRPTYAALVLLGTPTALRQHLADAELVYEYRSRDSSIDYQDRQSYRRAFVCYIGDLESRIEARNDLVQVEDGFLRREFRTLNPAAAREAILNAVMHRDYRRHDSVFVKQFPTRMVVESPGGFMPGITPENILDGREHRNRRLAEALELCGFVERSGQGMNRMFESAIEEGKPVPTFDGTDAYHVVLTQDGTVDPHLVRFLEEIGKETLASFDTWDYLTVRSAFLNKLPCPKEREKAKRLVDLGVLEKTGHGRGTRHVPSQRFHRFLGEEAKYTRRIGLDKETNKQLLLQHIQANSEDGAPLKDLAQVLPALAYRKVQGLVLELRDEGKILKKGKKRGSRWYPAGDGEANR